jgi:spore coat protein CotF
MLNITVPSDGPSKLTFSLFEKYDIPAPLSGVDAEINDNLILKQMEDLANEINDKTTTQYLSINDIIVAIWNDEFIQSYQDK